MKQIKRLLQVGDHKVKARLYFEKLKNIEHGSASQKFRSAHILYILPASSVKWLLPLAFLLPNIHYKERPK